MSTKLPPCEFCGRSYRPDRYNIGHQKYCTRPCCVQSRRQKRQREWSAKRRAADFEFVQAARVRCAEANRRRRRNSQSRTETQDDSPPLRDVVVGLLSHITDTVDPVQLRVCMSDYATRGQRVAFATTVGTDQP